MAAKRPKIGTRWPKVAAKTAHVAKPKRPKRAQNVVLRPGYRIDEMATNTFFLLFSGLDVIHLAQRK